LKAIDGDRSRLVTTDDAIPRALIAHGSNSDASFDAIIHLF
jgi:hypothetical protein